MVLASVQRILHSRPDAEEVMQESFAGLAGVSRPPDTPLGPWLHRVATNRAINRLKSDSARLRREVASPPPAPLAPDFARAELESLLDEALLALPAPLREALVGHYLLGKSQQALAAEWGISRQRVTRRVARGKEALRKELLKRGVATGAVVLGGALESLAAPPISAPLAVTIGKTALNIACNAPSHSFLANILRNLLMTTTQKTALAALAAVFLAGGIFGGRLLLPPAAPAPAKPALQAPKPLAALPAPTPAPKTPAPPAEVAADAPAEQPSDVPRPSLDGLWEVASYTWNGVPSGNAEEVFTADDHPQARLTTKDNTLHIALLPPWKDQAPQGSFSGTVLGDQVFLSAADKDALPLSLVGKLFANGTQIRVEGRYDLSQADGPNRDEVAQYRASLWLRKLGPGAAAPLLADLGTQEQRRAEAQQIATALAAYAAAHGGKLPANLSDLVPDFLPSDVLLKTGNHRAVRYLGGEVNPALLDKGTAWDDFKPGAPPAERAKAWQAYQEERWGGDSPLLPPALEITFDNPYLQVSVDALGRLTERDYAYDAPGLDSLPEMRAQSVQQLKNLGLSLITFTSANDGASAGGWVSVYPQYLEDPNQLTHPADAPGTTSYELLPRGDGAPAETPVAADAHPRGGDGQPGRDVVFADGHVQRLSEAEFAALCARLNIPVPGGAP